jgi:transposase
MANKVINMVNIRQILRLNKEGESLRKISEMLGIARKTVSKYLAIFKSVEHSYEEIARMSDEEVFEIFTKKEQPSKDRYEKLSANFYTISKELTRRGVNKYLLWEEYKEDNPDGYNYTQFCYHVNNYLQSQKPSMRMEHKSGDKMFVDYAGKKLSITNPETGEIKEAEVFVAILGKSQMTYVEASESQKKQDFIKSAENAFWYFGGVPRAVVPDNLTSAVTQPCKYEPQINEEFQRFALHYSTAILPARSRKPKDKSLVENAVRIIYTRIYAKLRERVFFSITELNEAIFEELEKHNNTKFQSRNYSRADIFEQSESKDLQNLPLSKYEIKEQKWLTVNKNCHIFLKADEHFYSVPYQYITKKVKVIYSKTTIEIYNGSKRIASHMRDYHQYRYTTVKEHLPSHHRFVSDWNADKFIKWGDDISTETGQYIREIIRRKAHPEQAYKSCIGILTLAKKVGKTRLSNACKRGKDFNSYSYPTIKNIISKGLDRELTETEEEKTIPLHENIRGETYYK